jgi:hypothetical protein
LDYDRLGDTSGWGGYNFSTEVAKQIHNDSQSQINQYRLGAEDARRGIRSLVADMGNLGSLNDKQFIDTYDALYGPINEGLATLRDEEVIDRNVMGGRSLLPTSELVEQSTKLGRTPKDVLFNDYVKPLITSVSETDASFKELTDIADRLYARSGRGGIDYDLMPDANKSLMSVMRHHSELFLEDGEEFDYTNPTPDQLNRFHEATRSGGYLSEFGPLVRAGVATGFFTPGDVGGKSWYQRMTEAPGIPDNRAGFLYGADLNSLYAEGVRLGYIEKGISREDGIASLQRDQPVWAAAHMDKLSDDRDSAGGGGTSRRGGSNADGWSETQLSQLLKDPEDVMQTVSVTVRGGLMGEELIVQNINIPRVVVFDRPDLTEEEKVTVAQRHFSNHLGIEFDDDGNLKPLAAPTGDRWDQKYFRRDVLMPAFSGLSPQSVLGSIPQGPSLDPEMSSADFEEIFAGSPGNDPVRLDKIFREIYGTRFGDPEDIMDETRIGIGAMSSNAKRDSQDALMANAMGDPRLGNLGDISLSESLGGAWDKYRARLNLPPMTLERARSEWSPAVTNPYSQNQYAGFWDSPEMKEAARTIDKVLMSDIFPNVLNEYVDGDLTSAFELMTETRESMSGSPLLNAQRWAEDLRLNGVDGWREAAGALRKMPGGEGYRRLYEALTFDELVPGVEDRSMGGAPRGGSVPGDVARGDVPLPSRTLERDTPSTYGAHGMAPEVRARGATPYLPQGNPPPVPPGFTPGFPGAGIDRGGRPTRTLERDTPSTYGMHGLAPEVRTRGVDPLPPTMGSLTEDAFPGPPLTMGIDQPVGTTQRPEVLAPPGFNFRWGRGASSGPGGGEPFEGYRPGEAGLRPDSGPTTGSVPGVDVPRTEREEIDVAVARAAEHYNVPRELMLAIIDMESSFRPGVEGKDGELGLMQLMPEIVKNYNISNPLDINENVMGGARLLRELLDAFGADWNAVIAAYNAGQGRIQGQMREGRSRFNNQPYADDVMERWNKLRPEM